MNDQVDNLNCILRQRLLRNIPSNSLRRGWSIIWCLFFFAVIFVDNLRAQEVGASNDEPGLLIAQLSADRFFDRQAAMKRLIALGRTAIDPIVAALPDGEPEMRIRGMAIIQRLATSRDSETAKVAQDTLRQLTVSADTDIARLASRTIDRLGEVLQEQAIEDLRALGADIPMSSQSFNGQRMVFNYTILIGSKWTGTREDLKLLQWISDAYRVTLIHPQVDDEIVQILARNPRLTFLKLKDAKITNQSIAYLAEQDSLNWLELVFCEIDNACVSEFDKMTNLSTLRLYGTNMDRQYAEEIATETSIDVDYRLGAFLGVYYNRDGQACALTDIVPESAAAKAGLQVGDIITQYGGTVIETSDDFQGIVSRNRPGDKVEVIVNRGGEEITLEIILGRMMDVDN